MELSQPMLAEDIAHQITHCHVKMLSGTVYFLICSPCQLAQPSYVFSICCPLKTSFVLSIDISLFPCQILALWLSTSFDSFWNIFTTLPFPQHNALWFILCNVVLFLRAAWVKRKQVHFCKHLCSKWVPVVINNKEKLNNVLLPVRHT